MQRFYYPKYLPANEIVRRAGFVVAKKGLGWERDVSPDKSRRLHATTHHGNIDVHWDKKGGAQGHTVNRTNPRIGHAIAEFGRIDRSAAPLLTRVANAILERFGLREN